MSVVLGKNVTFTGISNARSATVTNTASEVDVTKFGDTSRQFRKAVIEQTIELECVDAPGVSVGSNFTIAGTQTGDATYVCTSIVKSSPIDGIETYTVSGTRTS